MLYWQQVFAIYVVFGLMTQLEKPFLSIRTAIVFLVRTSNLCHKMSCAAEWWQDLGAIVSRTDPEYLLNSFRYQNLIWRCLLAWINQRIQDWEFSIKFRFHCSNRNTELNIGSDSNDCLVLPCQDISHNLHGPSWGCLMQSIQSLQLLHLHYFSW